MKKNKNTIASLLYIVASVCFFVSFLIGRNIVFLSLGVLMLAMFVLFYRRGKNNG